MTDTNFQQEVFDAMLSIVHFQDMWLAGKWTKGTPHSNRACARLEAKVCGNYGRFCTTPMHEVAERAMLWSIAESYPDAAQDIELASVTYFDEEAGEINSEATYQEKLEDLIEIWNDAHHRKFQEVYDVSERALIILKELL